MTEILDCYVETANQGVMRVQPAPVGEFYDELITSKSPEWQREAVVSLSRYLHLEAQCRMDLESRVDMWEHRKIEVLPMVDYIVIEDETVEALVGFMLFHTMPVSPELSPQLEPKLELYHCYIFPLYRKFGRMARAWEKAKERFGDFGIEPPLSHAMKGFLKKVDTSQIPNIEFLLSY